MCSSTIKSAGGNFTLSRQCYLTRTDNVDTLWITGAVEADVCQGTAIEAKSAMETSHLPTETYTITIGSGEGTEVRFEYHDAS